MCGRIPLPIPLPTPENSPADRLDKIVSKLLILIHSWVLEGRFSGVKTRFLPHSKDMPTGSASARRHLGLLRGQPAVDHEPGAGHEGGIVGGEKDDAFGDVVGRAEPPDRVAGQGKSTRRLDIVAAAIAGAADEGLVAHVGLDHPPQGARRPSDNEKRKLFREKTKMSCRSAVS
jgi:hypothetical protein